MPISKWNDQNIKDGIERYITEHGVPPTARDFDKVGYLPSARQIQRNFGGMASLRERLGYTELDFTKGELRKAIATEASSRGIEAEEYFEPLLMNYFGEPYVHTQKRYAEGTKNRYDFFIYAQEAAIGVDVFTTTRIEYIGVNVRHKIHKYKQLTKIETYFVLIGEYTAPEMEMARQSVPLIKAYPHLHLVSEKEFFSFIGKLEPLTMPSHFKGILASIVHIEQK